jgi:hypothetical protein
MIPATELDRLIEENMRPAQSRDRLGGSAMVTISRRSPW